MARLAGAIAIPREGGRPLVVEDALAYLDRVRAKFVRAEPHVYNTFLDIMKDFKAQRIDTPGVVQRVVSLFGDDRALVLAFGSFLPSNYRLSLQRGRVCAPRVRPGRDNTSHV